jgi:hypothetical protein
LKSYCLKKTLKPPLLHPKSNIFHRKLSFLYPKHPTSNPKYPTNLSHLIKHHLPLFINSIIITPHPPHLHPIFHPNPLLFLHPPNPTLNPLLTPSFSISKLFLFLQQPPHLLLFLQLPSLIIPILLLRSLLQLLRIPKFFILNKNINLYKYIGNKNKNNSI